jgi:hypothetical protein
VLTVSAKPPSSCATKSARAWSVSSAIARVDGEPPPSVALSSVASVTPAEPAASMVSWPPEPDSGALVSVGVSVVVSVGVSSAGLGVLEEAAGSLAVSSPPSEPQPVSPAPRTTPAATRTPNRVRAPERRRDVIVDVLIGVLMVM